MIQITEVWPEGQVEQVNPDTVVVTFTQELELNFQEDA